jgi:hypothetical protein
VLRNPVSTDRVLEQLRRYDAADAADVSAGVRASAGYASAVDELVGLYRAVIDEQNAAPAVDPAEELRAAAVYLRSLTPRFHERNLLVSLLRRTPVGPAVRAALAAHAMVGGRSDLLARLDRALGARL